VVEASLVYHLVERVEWTLYGSVWLGTSGVKEWTLMKTTRCKRGPLVVLD
jgi:hypothetical protein